MRTQPAQSNNEGNALGTQDDAGRRQEPRQKHGIFKTIIITTAILAIGIGLVAWWLNSRKFEGTDDAYVAGHIHAMSFRVSGTISEVLIDDNELVKVEQRIGQPCTIIPLSSLATTLLDPKYAGDGSALFNIARNLGGSVGTALLSTVIVQREQFHDFRIGENVNTFRLAVQSRVEQITSAIMAKGCDPVTATKRKATSASPVTRSR